MSENTASSFFFSHVGKTLRDASNDQVPLRGRSALWRRWSLAKDAIPKLRKVRTLRMEFIHGQQEFADGTTAFGAIIEGILLETREDATIEFARAHAEGCLSRRGKGGIHHPIFLHRENRRGSSNDSAERRRPPKQNVKAGGRRGGSSKHFWIRGGVQGDDAVASSGDEEEIGGVFGETSSETFLDAEAGVVFDVDGGGIAFGETTAHRGGFGEDPVPEAGETALEAVVGLDVVAGVFLLGDGGGEEIATLGRLRLVAHGVGRNRRNGDGTREGGDHGVQGALGGLLGRHAGDAGRHPPLLVVVVVLVLGQIPVVDHVIVGLPFPGVHKFDGVVVFEFVFAPGQIELVLVEERKSFFVEFLFFFFLFHGIRLPPLLLLVIHERHGDKRLRRRRATRTLHHHLIERAERKSHHLRQ
mmetsp:Transcript_34651/g.73076  ORF Transcript_34651/g.73076 Transcript_34651/m.73076 type:complete len:415 (-) Transcript_34651:814-2058(-)